MLANNKKGEITVINDWGLHYNVDWRNMSYTRRAKETRENFSVYVCPKCSVAFEITNDQYNKTKNTSYYKDFPTLGLKRKECFRCR